MQLGPRVPLGLQAACTLVVTGASPCAPHSVLFFGRSNTWIIFLAMESFKKLKLFPDKWYKKLNETEIRRAQNQITNYTISKDLDAGIMDVSISLFSGDQRGLVRPQVRLGGGHRTIRCCKAASA